MQFATLNDIRRAVRVFRERQAQLNDALRHLKEDEVLLSKELDRINSVVLASSARSKYRPFTAAEVPFQRLVRYKRDSAPHLCALWGRAEENGVWVGGGFGRVSFNVLLHEFEFENGEPCGVSVN